MELKKQIADFDSETAPSYVAYAREVSRGQTSRSTSVVTTDPVFKRVVEMARVVAPTQASVLITGESGTGKEVIARYIHDHSERAKNAFVAVNCAALPESLLESELFGYDQGAFTGAKQRKPGKFECANGGTILLDEISEIDISLQAKLLRVIQEREVERLGSNQSKAIDVRILATSNVDLKRAILKGQFREDLYYRLNVVNLKLVPLRERKSDLDALVACFLDRFSDQHGRRVTTLSSAVKGAFKRYDWPGNVRELQNVVEHAVLFCSGNTIESSHLPSDFTQVHPLDAAHQSPDVQAGMTIKAVEQQLILTTLTKTYGNRTHAARMLGISLRTLRNKINEYQEKGIEVPGYE